MESTQLSHVENQDLSQDELLEQLEVAEQRLKRIKVGLLGSFIFIVALFLTIVFSSSIFSSGRFVSEVVEIMGNDLMEDDDFHQSLANIALKYEQQLRRDLSSSWPGVADDLNTRYGKLVEQASNETRSTFRKGLSSHLGSQQFAETLKGIETSLELDLTANQKTRLKVVLKNAVVNAAVDSIKQRLESERDLIASLKTLPDQLSSGSAKKSLREDIPERIKTAGHRFVDDALHTGSVANNE